MGNLLRSGARTWEGNEDLDLPAATRVLGSSLNKLVVARYPDASTRDAGEADAGPGGEGDAGNGSVFFLASNGNLYCRSGGVNRRIPLYGVNYVMGQANVVTNSVGLFAIEHPWKNVAQLDAHFDHIYAGPSGAAEEVMNRVKLTIREFQLGGVIGYAGDVHAPGTPVANSSIVVGYRFETFP